MRESDGRLSLGTDIFSAKECTDIYTWTQKDLRERSKDSLRDEELRVGEK